jgi:hypothetical protein
LSQDNGAASERTRRGTESGKSNTTVNGARLPPSKRANCFSFQQIVDLVEADEGQQENP